MASIQERLQIKREPIDKWSIREQLCLASAVVRSGDQNWMSVSRALKPFGDSNRPSDWFHQKNCAAQYGSLLENVETPKRKKRNSSSETTVETPTESILRKLTKERLIELDKLLAEEKSEYKKLQEDMVLLQSGNVPEELLDQWCKEIDEEEKQREEDLQAHNRWLKEREKRKQEIERAWKPFSKGLTIIGQKRKATDSVDSLVEMDQSEDQQQTPQQPQTPTHDPSKPALSPLLTSLLKSPSHSQSVATSILHSAITSHSNSRNANSASNPTIASLLNSSACVSVSPGIQHLVSSAISQSPSSANAVTLSTSNLPETTAVDILEDAEDTLPNIKVEDIESTILSSDEPLPEIKNEEVEVIISDLIQNTDIVDNPEQHLQLDDNEDIITNLENELQELCEKEEMAEAARVAAAETSKTTTTTITTSEPILVPVVSSEINESSIPDAGSITSVTATISRSSSSNATPISSDAIQENPEASLSPVGVIETKIELGTPESQDNEETCESEKDEEREKESTQIDPFEFREEVEMTESIKPSSFSKHQEFKFSETKDEEKKTAKSFTDDVELGFQEEIKEIRKSTDEKHATEKHELYPGSVEIVEVVELEGEGIGTELNKKQIQDIVHSHKTSDTDISVHKDSENVNHGDKQTLKENCIQVKTETYSEDDENDLEVALQTEKSEKREKEQIPPITLIEPKREETFTPDFTNSFLDDLEVNKLDKMGKAKRDYSRTKKKEDKDFDILLAVEKAVNAHLEESEQVEDNSSENNFYGSEKKTDMKFKVKNENDRSNSPWTEEEDLQAIKMKRRSSATATPIDSIPNSPASSLLNEDDRDYRNWKKSVMLVYNRLATHKNASIFWKPITDDQAPGYHGLIHRPMDLHTIRKNIENGVIKTTSEFYRDVLLMFTNAIMFNKTNGTVYNMAKDMQQESLQPIKILMQAQQGIIPPKRETRTSESGNKRKRTGEENSRNKKRKDD
ncbi:bromodomain-containing protein 8 [Agrilus planipennis]|uniref:Bromodomain-containing protein 8 n=1 Tax=Agrilus planipennis TaxID=224129 RepID=A0A1W4XC19_AGRPL|nr:bromodomain-containing protein 8 [Agrilus planipennis]